jgi:putative endonuclease
MSPEDPLRGARDALLKARAARGKGGIARDHRRVLGRYGEKIALEYLRAHGFTLLVRNYRTRRGEIDLIVFDGGTLVFVEVKTQLVEESGARVWKSPLEYLSAQQLARYRPVAEAYLVDERCPCPEAQRMRFDAIGVLVDEQGELVSLQHVEGDQ